MKKIIISLLMTFILLGTLIAGGAQGKPVTINYFSGRVETVDWTDNKIAEFEALHPEIRVIHEFQKDASNVMKVKLASQDIPDITTVVTQEFIDQGVFLDLSDAPFWDRILPSVKDLCTDLNSGKQFKVATNVTMGGLFYNKEMFSDLGLKDAATWDGFVENLEAVKAAYPDVTPLFLGGRDSWTLGHLIEFWAHGIIKQKYGIPGSRKAFLENDKAKLAWDAPGGVMESFAAALLELQEKGLINADAVTATYDNQKEAFASGKAAMINQGMWVVGDIIKLNPAMTSNIGFGPFPSVIDGFEPMVLCAEDSVFAISATSENVDEAMIFLEYLFSPEVQVSYSEARGMPSAFTDVISDWSPIKDDAKRLVDTYVNINFSTEAPSALSVDDTGRLIQELLSGVYDSPREFAVNYAKLWNAAY
ncbi:MAG: extracellular solute-binding protein [Spirochaetaceae bacterium]|jgi:raffinose/stachyose/melibiose transport system substrate-binding protein|nr:extracellular solute-binding protein [Spirochaetaceae bacterium]